MDVRFIAYNKNPDNTHTLAHTRTRSHTPSLPVAYLHFLFRYFFDCRQMTRIQDAKDADRNKQIARVDQAREVLTLLQPRAFSVLLRQNRLGGQDKITPVTATGRKWEEEQRWRSIFFANGGAAPEGACVCVRACVPWCGVDCFPSTQRASPALLATLVVYRAAHSDHVRGRSCSLACMLTSLAWLTRCCSPLCRCACHRCVHLLSLLSSFPASPGRGAKLGSHGVKIDGVALLITVFDMTELTESSPPDAAEGSVGTAKTDTDARSLAARTKLRLLCYDPVHNSSGSLVCASCSINPHIYNLYGSTCQPECG